MARKYTVGAVTFNNMFEVGMGAPLDNRDVVEYYADLASSIGDNKYEGEIVYVTNDTVVSNEVTHPKGFYTYDGTSWVQFKSGGGDSTLQTEIVVTTDVGGITKPKTYTVGTSYETILHDLLSPYVAFDYTVSGTAASGSFEYGTSKTITKFTVTITDGTVSPTSLLIGTTEDGSDIKSVSNPTTGDITLDTSISLDGTQDKTYYFKMVDGTSTVKKTLSYTFQKHIYYGSISSASAPTSSTGLSHSASVTGVNITTSNNQYVVFVCPTQKTAIQQNVMGQWVDINTTSLGSVSFTTSTGAVVTYYCYISDSMIATTQNYKIR